MHDDDIHYIRGLPYLAVVVKANGDAVGEVRRGGGEKGWGGTLLAEKGRHGTGQEFD
jgi:hypothetical protein